MESFSQYIKQFAQELVVVFILNEGLIWVFLSLARSHMIDSPPTYNADYGYKSWEAYSNLSYYTRSLPPVPQDCPTPMGVVGEYTLYLWRTSFLRFLRYKTVFVELHHRKRAH